MSDHTHAGTDCFDPECGLRKLLDYDAVLDGLVEKTRLMKRSGSPDYYEDLGEAVPRHVLRTIDAPSLVLLLREARELMKQMQRQRLVQGTVPNQKLDDLIVRIDAKLEGLVGP